MPTLFTLLRLSSTTITNVSSVNWQVLLLDIDKENARDFTYNKKNGPNIEQSGTPYLIDVLPEIYNEPSLTIHTI